MLATLNAITPIFLIIAIGYLFIPGIGVVNKIGNTCHSGRYG